MAHQIESDPLRGSANHHQLSTNRAITAADLRLWDASQSVGRRFEPDLPTIRFTALTLAFAAMANDAAVCLRSCGVSRMIPTPHQGSVVLTRGERPSCGTYPLVRDQH